MTQINKTEDKRKGNELSRETYVGVFDVKPKVPYNQKVQY